MKKMFTLRGVGSCGKTTKIKEIAKWILSSYPHAENHGLNFNKKDVNGFIEVNKLKIGFVSAGDNLKEVSNNDILINKFPDIDIIINACRTRGKGRKYLEKNYNSDNGWLVKNIFVKKITPFNQSELDERDAAIIEELRGWLTGLEKC